MPLTKPSKHFDYDEREPQRNRGRHDPDDPKQSDDDEIIDPASNPKEYELDDVDIMEELDDDDLHNMEGPDA